MNAKFNSQLAPNHRATHGSLNSKKLCLAMRLLALTCISIFAQACAGQPQTAPTAPATSAPAPQSVARPLATGTPAIPATALPVPTPAIPTTILPVPPTPTALTPVQVAQSYQYDPNGNLIGKTTPNGATIRYEYDALDRLSTILYPDGDKAAFTYDAHGNLTQMRDSTVLTRYGYDSFNRLTEMTDVNGSTFKFEYDMADNLTALVDPKGQRVTYKYDSYGRLGAVSDASGTVTYRYDAADRLVERILPNGVVTTYSYDATGRLNGIAYLTQTGQILMALAYTLDPAGNVLRIVQTFADGRKLTTTYSYDQNRRLMQMTQAGDSQVIYIYDQNGNRIEMRDSLGITRYRYDSLSRLVEVSDANGHTTKYEYDPSDNLTTLVYPDGQKVTYQYDSRGRLERVTDGSGTTTYRYDAAGRLVRRTLPNGVATAYSYDTTDRLIGITHTNPSGQVLMAFAYTLDALGNPLQTVQTMADGSKLTTAYAYDEAGRLIQITYPDRRTVKYRYDKAGNRLEMIAPEGTTTYTYDAQGCLLRAGSTIFAYDANGNRIEKKEGDKITRYRYDHQNRLVEVNDGSKVIGFSYDGDGNLLRKTVDGVTSHYVYDVLGLRSELVAELGPDGQWVQFPLGWERLGEVKPQGNSQFYLTDDLGSVVGLSDEKGLLLATYSYDPFGTPLVSPVRTSQVPSSDLQLHQVAQHLAPGGGSLSASMLATPPPPVVLRVIWVLTLPFDPTTGLLDATYDPKFDQYIQQTTSGLVKSLSSPILFRELVKAWVDISNGIESRFPSFAVDLYVPTYKARIWSGIGWIQREYSRVRFGRNPLLLKSLRVAGRVSRVMDALDIGMGGYKGLQALEQRQGRVGSARIARPWVSLIAAAGLARLAAAMGPWGLVMIPVVVLVNVELGQLEEYIVIRAEQKAQIEQNLRMFVSYALAAGWNREAIWAWLRERAGISEDQLYNYLKPIPELGRPSDRDVVITLPSCPPSCPPPPPSDREPTSTPTAVPPPPCPPFCPPTPPGGVAGVPPTATSPSQPPPPPSQPPPTQQLPPPSQPSPVLVPPTQPPPSQPPPSSQPPPTQQLPPPSRPVPVPVPPTQPPLTQRTAIQRPPTLPPCPPFCGGGGRAGIGTGFGIGSSGTLSGQSRLFPPPTEFFDTTRNWALLGIGMDQFGRPYRFNFSGSPAQFVNSRSGTAVGGVSFDKVAQVLVNLNDITGATLDPNTGQLILIGKKDTRLPPMNLDDLVVAIRSVYAGKDPGVTMVPVDPSWKDSTQRVEYFGATGGTRFGLTMFEADRYLKGLGAGKDSFTGEPVTPNVPGFKPEIDLACEYQTDVPWHRNWFVPNEVVLKQSADGKSMVFERATMRLESRFVQIRPDGTMVDVPGTSPVTDRFTRFVTEHYDEFAREKAELAELTRLAKIVGLVRWLRDNNIPVDLSWVNDYQVTKVETPKTTPGVSAEKVCFGGTFTTTSQGGVDYSTPNTYNQEDSQVHALRERAVASRPATVPLTWDLQQDGTTYTAVALNLAPSKTVGGYVTNQTDIALPTQGGLGVQFTRFYNSLDIRDSALGYGWSFIPYGLDVQKVLRPSGNKQFLVETQVRLFDAARSSVEMFEGPYKESQTGRVFYQPKCTACGYVDLTVQPDGGYILRRQDRILVSFNSQGQLSGFADENGNRVDYRYSGERLSEIGAPGGATLKLTYDSKGRLVQVTASDGRAAKYTFDSAGHLTSVTDATGYRTTYAYDSEHRLTAITDAAGRTLVEHKYDGLGRLVEQKGAQGYAVSAAYDPANRQATYTDTRGYRAVRTYDEQQRLVKETDPLGQSITYGYDKDGNLARFTDKRGNTTGYTYDQMGNLTQVTTPLKTAVQFGYDANRNLRYSIDPQMQLVLYEYDSRNNLTRVTDGLKVVRLNPDGSFSYDSSRAFSTQFEYDSYGNVKAVVGANGRRTEFGYDARGNLTSIKSAGRETRQEFDARARLTRVIDPLGRSAQFTYDDRDLMTGVTTAAGTTRYEYDAVGNLVKVTDANGNATRYVYDASGNLVQVIEATSAVTRYEYDVVGNLVAVIDANQRRTNFEYDALGRVVRETFTISGTSR